MTKYILIYTMMFSMALTTMTPEVSYAKGAKTVRVKSYTKKSGKHVTTHKRSRPSK